MRIAPLRLLVGTPVCVLALTLAAPPAGASIVRPEPESSTSFDQTVRAMAVMGSTVYVAGDFTQAQKGQTSVTRRHVAAVDAATGRLLPWRVSVNGPVRTVAVSRGSVYLGGEFTKVDGRRVHGLARVSATSGKIDPSFRPRVVGSVEALAFTQRRVYLGGEFNTVNGEHRTRLAAVSRQGRLQPWSPRANNTVLEMRTADGLVYAGGLFSAVNGDPAHGFLVALTPRTGSVSPKFEARLPVPALDFRITDRRVFVGAGGPGGRLTALSRSGAFRWSQTFDGDVAAVQVLGGRIYVGGHWEYICATRRVADTTGDCLSEGEILRPRLAAFRMNGARTSWAPRPDSAEGVLALTSAAGRLAVGGAFDTFGAGEVRQPKFAQFAQR